MRVLRDLMLLVLIAAGAVGAFYFLKFKHASESVEQAALESVRRLEREVKVRGVTSTTTTNNRGFPTTIDPAWFADDAPRNPLLSPNRPWIDVAGPDETHLHHPLVRIALDESLAAFWYNPSNGIIRARVPVGISDETSTTLYNRVNQTALVSIFDIERTPAPTTSSVPDADAVAQSTAPAAPTKPTSASTSPRAPDAAAPTPPIATPAQPATQPTMKRPIVRTPSQPDRAHSPATENPPAKSPPPPSRDKWRSGEDTSSMLQSVITAPSNAL